MQTCGKDGTSALRRPVGAGGRHRPSPGATEATGARCPEGLGPAVVRVRSADGTPVGSGFLLAPGTVATCAHVVAQAPRTDARAESAPTSPVTAEFPFQRGGAAVETSLSAWQPPAADGTGDIALLRLPGHAAVADTPPVRLAGAGERLGAPLPHPGLPGLGRTPRLERRAAARRRRTGLDLRGGGRHRAPHLPGVQRSPRLGRGTRCCDRHDGRDRPRPYSGHLVPDPSRSAAGPPAGPAPLPHHPRPGRRAHHRPGPRGAGPRLAQAPPLAEGLPRLPAAAGTPPPGPGRLGSHGGRRPARSCAARCRRRPRSSWRTRGTGRTSRLPSVRTST
uniref:trypsin-like peptidase domain-containing protein n=1 Tax=Streptomyces sp. DG1A-41 TaxID=3125779 RepID=UPI00404012CD